MECLRIADEQSQPNDEDVTSNPRATAPIVLPSVKRQPNGR
jgi:hypothetical protein